MPCVYQSTLACCTHTFHHIQHESVRGGLTEWARSSTASTSMAASALTSTARRLAATICASAASSFPVLTAPTRIFHDTSSRDTLCASAAHIRLTAPCCGAGCGSHDQVLQSCVLELYALMTHRVVAKVELPTLSSVARDGLMYISGDLADFSSPSRERDH